MSLKKIGMALVAVLALGAVMANTAFGAATTTDVQWYLNGSSLSASQAVTSGLVGTATLETEVGETPLKLASTGLECVDCTIFNFGSSAKGEGELKFTGVSVVTPSGCEVIGGAVQTNELKVDADYMIETKNYVRLAPVGAAAALAGLTLKAKMGKTCAISGPYLVKGSVFVKSQNATGVGATKQFVNSSGPINTEAGGELKFGLETATLTGEAWFEAGGKSFETK